MIHPCRMSRSLHGVSWMIVSPKTCMDHKHWSAISGFIWSRMRWIPTIDDLFVRHHRLLKFVFENCYKRQGTPASKCQREVQQDFSYFKAPSNTDSLQQTCTFKSSLQSSWLLSFLGLPFPTFLVSSWRLTVQLRDIWFNCYIGNPAVDADEAVAYPANVDVSWADNWNWWHFHFTI